jgi:tRNA(Met) C34 N-acetyltransferase TmcA
MMGAAQQNDFSFAFLISKRISRVAVTDPAILAL